MKAFSLIITILLFNLYIHSQKSKIQYANELLIEQNFDKTAEIYEYIADRYIKKREQLSTDDKNKLFEYASNAANNYLKSGNYDKSYFWYNYLINNFPQLLDYSTKSNYIRLLIFLKKEDDLKRIYKENLLSDSLLIRKIHEYFNKSNYEDSSLIFLQKLSFNSTYNEFSAIRYNDSTLFYVTQKRPNSAFLNISYPDNQYYQSLFVIPVKFEKDTVLIQNREKFHKSKYQTKFHDGPVAFTPDGNLAFITQNNLSQKKYLNKIDNYKIYNVNLYVYKKTLLKNKREDWILFDTLPMNSIHYSCGHAAYSSKDSILYFVSNKEGGFGGTDIWGIKYSYQNKKWGEPFLLGDTINTKGNEMFPFVDTLGNLYFSSDGHLVNIGGMDIYKYNKIEKNLVHFSYPLNSHRDDFGISIFHESDKVIAGFISTNRENSQDKFQKSKKNKGHFYNNDDVYFFKYKIPYLQLVISTIDSIAQLPLPLTMIKIEEDLQNKNYNSIISDSIGKASIDIKPQKTYLLHSSKPNYKSLNIVYTYNSSYKNDTIYATLYLRKYQISFKGKILNDLEQKTIAGADILLIDNEGKLTKYHSNDSGYFNIPLSIGNQYKLKIVHPNYDTLISDISTPDLIFNDTIILGNYILKKRYKVNDIFVLKNIYFDYGKYDLRPESIIELDKLYNFLLENPKIKIELSAHTDSRSSFNFNLKLSHNRAKICYEYLVKKGIDKKRIAYKGYSYLKLVNHCKPGVKCTEEEHQMNRRTEIKILKVD